nr:unnamed protein product [Spirometra erinaceieuropaei]
MSYGSRAHKVSSIFRRVDGLLKNNGIKNSDRPLWPLPDQHVRNLIYPEDFGRVFVDFFLSLFSSFLSKFDDDDLHNLFNPKDEGSVMSKVISKGMALKLEDFWDKEDVFDRIREALQKDGVLLHERKKT